MLWVMMSTVKERIFFWISFLSLRQTSPNWCKLKKSWPEQNRKISRQIRKNKVLGSEGERLGWLISIFAEYTFNNFNLWRTRWGIRISYKTGKEKNTTNSILIGWDRSLHRKKQDSENKKFVKGICLDHNYLLLNTSSEEVLPAKFSYKTKE